MMKKVNKVNNAKQGLIGVSAVLFGVLAMIIVITSYNVMPKPQTPNQKLAYGYAMINSITQDTISMYNIGKIDKDTASKVYHVLVAAKSALDTAAKSVNNEASFETYSGEAMTLIQQAQDIINGGLK